ncbi:MAG: RNA polymerase sigma factor [Persicimonas sp.]
MELRDSEEKLEAFRRGDRDLLEALYRHWVDDIRQMLRAGFTFTSQGDTVRFRGIKEPFRLQEAVQESFIHAFRKKAREAYDGSRSFGPYLRTIVRNRIIDRYRRKKLESKLFVHLGDLAHDDEADQQVLERLSGDPDEVDPEESTWRGELSATLDAFVDRLDDVEGRILREHMIGERTQREMADALGVSRNDVRKHIRHIRSSLLRHLKSEGVIDELEASEAIQAVTTLLVMGRL